MNQATILIAEDDPSILQGVVDLLETEGYQVHCVTDGQQALQAFQQHHPDLVILDVMMPGLNGFEVCKEIRKHDSHTPILFLTAQNQEMDQVFGLRSGGDDYVTKPFGMQSLLARVEALLRRAQPKSAPQTNHNSATAQTAAAEHESPPAAISGEFEFGEARVDRKRYEIHFRGEVLSLSARELALLELFHQHPRQVLDRNTLLQNVWGIHYYGTTRTLDQHIAQLRKKVEIDPKNPQHLVTVHGVGYVYEPL